MSQSSFFNNEQFMPHGMCYLWQPDVLWTSVISDVTIALAYYSVTLAFIVFVKRRTDLLYPWFFILAGSIIFLACGTSHLISAIVIWEPIYGVSAVVKAITAISSLVTGIAIWYVLPFFLTLPSPSLLKKKNTALQDSLDKLNAAQKQLIESEKMASLGRLVAGVAHELNTPIGVCITASSYLQYETNNLNESQNNGQLTKDDFTHYIVAATQSAEIIAFNLNRAAEQIRNFKRVAVDISSEIKREFDVNEYLHQIRVSFSPELRNTQHQIEIKCKPRFIINSYPGTFSQIISNLIMNSIFHAFDGGEKGHIMIKAWAEGDMLHLTYSDDGKGMETEVVDKIFDPFFSTKHGSGSSGLGLHILYNMVTQTLGGKVKCTSQPGKGTIFEVAFSFEES